ncbi:cytochrome P450 monooxygenase [Physcia stellaris]|nr:cytochrome P450 monooxygenase [Physcia stellaris]
MPGQKMYIVTTLGLIQIIQKMPKLLAFPPIEAKFASQICGTSAEAHEILMKNVNGDEGSWGLSMDTYEAMRAALKPGTALDSMNRLMVQSVAASLDSLAAKDGKSRKIHLSSWLRHSITAATTNSVYGPQNPFKARQVVEAFWQFENNLMSILVGILPSIMARKGLTGRATVVKAFESYFLAGGHKQASVLMQNRFDTGARNGIAIKDIARFEIGGALALLVNTAPATFGCCCSSMPILVFLRSLKSTCPLLTSTFQEVLRYRSMGTSVRQVTKDTLLDGQWLLKKDSMVQMPSRVLHSDSSLWGPEAHEFNPRRFMKSEGQPTKSKRAPAAAFRAFGGGSTLCPGRHFATNEVLAVVSMFVMRYEMVPLSGKWTLPTVEKSNAASVIMEPDTDVEVLVSQREGYEGDRWSFELKDSDEIFAVAAEDTAEYQSGA